MNRGYALRRCVVLAMTAGAIALAGGCQAADRTITARTESGCTTCQAQTRVMPLTGMSYTADSCPSCRRISTLDEATQMAVERAVGGQVGDTVHTCDRCNTLTDCPVCRREGS